MPSVYCTPAAGAERMQVTRGRFARADSVGYGTIEVRLHRDTGAPTTHAAANVYLLGPRSNVVRGLVQVPTTREPQFIAREIPPGAYGLRITMLAYKPFSRELEVGAGERLQIVASLHAPEHCGPPVTTQAGDGAA